MPVTGYHGARCFPGCHTFAAWSHLCCGHDCSEPRHLDLWLRCSGTPRSPMHPFSYWIFPEFEHSVYIIFPVKDPIKEVRFLYCTHQSCRRDLKPRVAFRTTASRACRRILKYCLQERDKLNRRYCVLMWRHTAVSFLAYIPAVQFAYREDVSASG